METYAGEDGYYYGAPYHIGATTMYYNVAAMAEAMGLSNEDVIAMISPDGHVDLEAGFQNILDHNIVSFSKALWFMSRFTNYMPEEKATGILPSVLYTKKDRSAL